jgi:hypothetical protein
VQSSITPEVILSCLHEKKTQKQEAWPTAQQRRHPKEAQGRVVLRALENVQDVPAKGDATSRVRRFKVDVEFRRNHIGPRQTEDGFIEDKENPLMTVMTL